MRSLSLAQSVIACCSLLCVTGALMTGHLDESIAAVIYSAVVSGALGYVNGKKSGSAEG